MIGMEDENLIHRLFNERINNIFFGGHTKGHPQKVSGIAEVILGINEGLTKRIFIRCRSNCGHFRDQAMRSNHPLMGISDISRIVIESRKRANNAAHDRHWMRIAAETPIKLHKLFMQHRVARDGVREFIKRRFVGQFAVQQQVGDLHKARLLGQLTNWVTTVEQNAFVAVNICQR